MSFFTGYFDDYDNLVTDRKKIGKRVLSSRYFIFDVLGNIPVELIGNHIVMDILSLSMKTINALL